MTLQGEGARAGSKALFLRLVGCNLWNGLPQGRASGKGACARWCDTDFARGERVSLDAILARAEELWPADGVYDNDRWIVITGGEPMLQVDVDLVVMLHRQGWKVAVETNGTISKPIMDELDWLTVSPKKGGELVYKRGHELKVILPGATSPEEGWTDEELASFEALDFEHFFIQPQDPIHMSEVGDTYLHPIQPRHYLARTYSHNLARCIEWVQNHPTWRLSDQLHKRIRLP